MLYSKFPLIENESFCCISGIPIDHIKYIICLIVNQNLCVTRAFLILMTTNLNQKDLKEENQVTEENKREAS